MNCIVCAAMLALSRPRVCQCPLTQITLCVGLLVYFQNYFFRGGLCDESLWVFLHSKSLFVCSACSSRPVSILEPSAMNVNHTAKWSAVDCTFLRGHQAIRFSFFFACARFMHACIGKCSDVRGSVHKYLFSTLGY